MMQNSAYATNFFTSMVLQILVFQFTSAIQCMEITRMKSGMNNVRQVNFAVNMKTMITKMKNRVSVLNLTKYAVGII